MVGVSVVVWKGVLVTRVGEVIVVVGGWVIGW